MIMIKCTYTNGEEVITRINANIEKAKRYYEGRIFNLGTVNDNMQMCIKCEELKKLPDNK